MSNEAKAMREAAGKVARDHRDDAVRARRTPGRAQIMRFASDESRAEILAEERGEKIASEIIEKAILALPIPEPRPDPGAALRGKIEADPRAHKTAELLKRAMEELRLIRAKDCGAVYDTTLRSEYRLWEQGKTADPAEALRLAETAIKEAIDLWDDTVAGNYKPDSFTAQPLHMALAAIESIKGGG